MKRINMINTLISIVMILFFYANHGLCTQNPIFLFTGDGRYISFIPDEGKIIDTGIMDLGNFITIKIF